VSSVMTTKPRWAPRTPMLLMLRERRRTPPRRRQITRIIRVPTLRCIRWRLRRRRLPRRHIRRPLSLSRPQRVRRLPPPRGRWLRRRVRRPLPPAHRPESPHLIGDERVRRGVERRRDIRQSSNERARDVGRAIFLPPLFSCRRDDRRHAAFRPAVAIATMRRQQEPRDLACLAHEAPCARAKTAPSVTSGGNDD